MEKQETGLEVRLVNRADHGKPGTDKSFYANVVKTEVIDGKRYLRVFEDSHFGAYPALCDLLMKNYYILEISWEPGDGVGKVEELYKIEEEDQNDAFETIDQILSDEAELSEAAKEEEKATVVGPKRIEVTLRRIGEPLDEKDVVITSLTPASGTFTYISVGGRNWKKEALSRSIQFYNSTCYWLVKIACYSGGLGGSLTETFIATPADQKRAWETLEKNYSHFKQPELNVVREWTPKGSAVAANPLDDNNNLYGEVHYYNRVPAAYQPKPKPVATLRISRDEIGVTLYREQTERQKVEPRTLAELVALEKQLASKKPEEDEKKTMGTPSPDVNPDACDCGSPQRPSCWGEYYAGHVRPLGGVEQRPKGVTIH